jgi:hypothetical protein
MLVIRWSRLATNVSSLCIHCIYISHNSKFVLPVLKSVKMAFLTMPV